MIGDPPAAAPFLRARLAALYLLSLAAVDAAFLAWLPARLETALFRFGPPLWLGAAALAGAAVHDRLSLLAERLGRSRFRAVGGTLHACVLAYPLLGVLTGQRQAVESGVAALAALQPLFLLLSGAGRGSVGAVLNAAALTVLAAVAGGWGAAAGVTAHVPLLIVFLAADRLSRALAEYPVDEPPGPGLLAREAVLPAVLSGLLLGGFFAVVPPRAYAPFVAAPAAGVLEPDRILDLALQLLGIAGMAAIGFYLLLRWGGRSVRSHGELEVRRPVGRRRLEKASAPAPAWLPAPEGLRGRVVRLYLRMLEQLARRGLRRLQGETPRELEPRLSPSGSAAEATDLFMRARYGLEEPGVEDVGRMEKACEEVLNPGPRS